MDAQRRRSEGLSFQRGLAFSVTYRSGCLCGRGSSSTGARQREPIALLMKRMRECRTEAKRLPRMHGKVPPPSKPTVQSYLLPPQLHLQLSTFIYNYNPNNPGSLVASHSHLPQTHLKHPSSKYHPTSCAPLIPNC